ncbi:MAG: hypothetical protein WBA40_22225 [Roseiarcus sp.]
MGTKGDDTAASFSIDHLLECSRAVAVCFCPLAMFVSRFGVLLRVFVLADVMVMGGLMMMMMRGSVVMSGSLMMMLTGRMLRGLCHSAIPRNRSWKTDAGCT